mmetsp:Transcript_41097/g.46836  ORF Transcript_41097/g.46836 Transcript_41097/m.46836 type:complete len:80 (+) Transcript_41097:177-416(+)
MSRKTTRPVVEESSSEEEGSDSSNSSDDDVTEESSDDDDDDDSFTVDLCFVRETILTTSKLSKISPVVTPPLLKRASSS